MRESLPLRLYHDAQISWKSVTLVLGFAALTALAAKVQFYFLFSPVPVTLQSLAVTLSAVVLGSRKAVMAQATLIGAGLAGLPVFSSPLPGLTVILGPTGGYILGFLLCAYVTGKLFETHTHKIGFLKSSFYFFIGSMFIFIPGITWLSVFTGDSLTNAVLIGFVPFLAGDILKCLIAAATIRSASLLSR